MFFLYGNHERKKDLRGKSAALLRQEAHIKEAIVQRQCYNKKVNFARDRADLHFFKGRKGPSSISTTFSYSFDFAQQVAYPSNPDQTGDIYFNPILGGVFLHPYSGWVGRGGKIVPPV